MDICFALDLDGTAVEKENHIAPNLVTFFEKMIGDKCQLIFITGRTFFFSTPLFSDWKVPYTLAPYNGASLISMPHKEVIQNLYISDKEIQVLERLLTPFHLPIVGYTSVDEGEKSYSKKMELSSCVAEAKERRRKVLYEAMHDVETLADIDKPFLAVRILATEEEAHGIAELVKEELELSTILMTDTVNPGFCIVQIANAHVGKDRALDTYLKEYPKKPYVIAAGDDYNDIPLLKVADVAIAMEHAPAGVKSYADIVAPPIMQGGLQHALEEALRWAK